MKRTLQKNFSIYDTFTVGALFILVPFYTDDIHIFKSPPTR